MKIRTLVMALAAFSFMLTACENKPAQQEQKTDNPTEAVAEGQTETVAEEETEAPHPFTVDDVNQIGVIISVWDVMPIPVLALEGKTDIERFAASFCNEYSNYYPNQVLYNYLKDPNYKEENYELEKDGYIACKGMFQFSSDVCCHVWDRQNGHKLVAFWLEEAHENGETTYLLALYDFDPATNTLNPEPELTKKVVEPMSQYDAYTVRLDREDKEVCLIGYNINIEEDNAESTCYMLRWNGNDFSIEKEK